MSSHDASPTSSRAWYQLIGPGLITACVVIGPGSILSSSRVGATNGYSLSWVIVVAVVFMLIYMTLGARLGVTASESPADLVTKRAGRWLAALIGLGVFFISAAFQFGNNLGVSSAFEIFVGKDKLTLGIVVVLFNALTISFLFVFKNLYKAVERLMMVFVSLMLSAFLINLLFAQPNWGDLFIGFIPEFLRGVERSEGKPLLDISVLAMVGTTFVITAAYFQAYLVRQKGWTHHELKEGARDTRVGAVIMCVITLMIMMTAAAQFHNFTSGAAKQDLKNVADVARQLEPSLGVHAKWLFALGVFSAAYSSFLVNSMIGGFILADGLGLGSKPEDMWPRLLTTLVLVTGMGVALFVIRTGIKPVPAIIAAQAVTVLAAPLMAGALLWLTNRKDVMGEDANSVPRNIGAGLGFVLLLAMAGYTAFVKIPESVEKWQASQQAEKKINANSN